MSRLKTVYLVTRGEYSDYRISAVFSTRALAEALARLIPDANDVGEYPLDPPLPAKHPRWRVWMDREGNNAETKRVSWNSDFLPKVVKGTFNCYVNGEDETQAIKAANEKRAQFIAAGRWPGEGEA